MRFWNRKKIKTKYVYKTIHNKYDVGQKVFMIKSDVIHQTSIVEVGISIKDNYVGVFYTVKDSPYGRSGKVRGFYEHEIFESPEELTEQLKNNLK